jgi:hypothetical protein
VRPSRIRAEQDRALSRYVRHEVYAYSSFHRARLDAAGLGRTGIRRREDLRRLPPVPLADVDPTAIVLRPDAGSVARFGSWRTALEMRWARYSGQAAQSSQAKVDTGFKPVRWTIAGGVPLGYTAGDGERLAELGRRLLETAGLRVDDVLVGVAGEASSAGFWQLAEGARAGGVSALFVAPDSAPDVVARLHPTVLAGSRGDLVDLLHAVAMARLRMPELRTVLVVGDLLHREQREELVGLAADAVGLLPAGPERAGDGRPAVVCAYAPPGVRALWGQCRGGDAFHTWPASEVVEVEAERLLWTAVGWRGSVLLRLRTDVAAVIDPSPCEACGRTTPRLRLEPADGRRTPLG